MKKTLSKILISALLCLNLHALADTSNNSFNLAIPRSAIPTGSSDPQPAADPSSDDDGVSSGAVVGIVLGSIAGGIALLGGLAWYYFARGTKAGAATAHDYPLSAICIDSNTPARLQAQGDENIYLIKALEVNGIRECPNSRYVLVADNNVQNKTFNSVFFNVPEEMANANGTLNVRVTQVSDPFTGKEFEGKIFTGRSTDTEVKLNSVISEESKGIVQKEGKISLKGKTSESSVLMVSYDKLIEAAGPMRYAYVIEFYR